MAKGLFDLTGKVAVVTGGNSGLGLSFARGMAKQGADIMIWSRNQERNREAVEELREFGVRAESMPIDVGSEEAVVRGMAETVEMFGRVDCAIANAGTFSNSGNFIDLTSDMYHGLLNINQHGAFYTLREATRHMRERANAGDPGGSLVVCGSLSIFHGLQGMEHYAGAKGALAAMVKGLAVEMGQYKVRANMLAPGFIMSEMTEGSTQVAGMVEHFSKITPLGRPGYPHDIEGPAAYLASDASKFHTGDILVIDGGRTVKSL